MKGGGTISEVGYITNKLTEKLMARGAEVRKFLKNNLISFS